MGEERITKRRNEMRRYQRPEMKRLIHSVHLSKEYLEGKEDKMEGGRGAEEARGAEGEWKGGSEEGRRGGAEDW